MKQDPASSLQKEEENMSQWTKWKGVQTTILMVTAIIVGAIFLWFNTQSFLLLFAGILFASFLDTCTRELGRIIPLGRPWRLAIVVLLLTIGLVYLMLVGFAQFKTQATILYRIIETQIDVVHDRLTEFGVDVFGPEGARDFSSFFPDPQQLFGHVQFAVGTASGLLISGLIIVCLGLFFAGNPAIYRESVLSLVPLDIRGRARDVFNEMGHVLRSWLVGQFVRIIIVSVIMAVGFYWLGLPGAILLAVLAGASNFIPYLGPLVATIPVALVAMPLGTSTFAWAMIFYMIVQNVEGYILGPMIQRGVMNLPPAWTLLAITICGAMFGIIGIALATPILAVLRIAIIRFYIEDRLGDRQDRGE
ncbi:MAG: AI-2E family transporter [Phyllobacterium sp.]